MPDLPFGMRMAMGERHATRAEQSNARRAYTRAEKADKLDTSKFQRVVSAEREAVWRKIFSTRPASTRSALRMSARSFANRWTPSPRL